jgi:hypothetical protein
MIIESTIKVVCHLTIMTLTKLQFVFMKLIIALKPTDPAPAVLTGATDKMWTDMFIKAFAVGLDPLFTLRIILGTCADHMFSALWALDTFGAAAGLLGRHWILNLGAC